MPSFSKKWQINFVDNFQTNELEAREQGVAEGDAGRHEGEAAAGGVCGVQACHAKYCWHSEAAGVVKSRTAAACQAARRWPDRFDGEGKDDEEEGGEIRERDAPRMLGTQLAKKLDVLFVLFFPFLE